MRLLIDLQALQNGSRRRGIGRYVRALARAIVRNAPDFDVRFLVSDMLDIAPATVMAELADLASPERFHVFHGVGPTAAIHDPDQWRHRASLLMYRDLVDTLAPDVLLIGSLFEGGADNVITTIASCRTVCVLFDLIPLLDPERHIGSPGARRWYLERLGEACRCDLLLAISQSAALEARQHLAVDPEHVVHIGAAASEEFAGVEPDRLRGTFEALDVLAYHGLTRPYLMHASALDDRKNFDGLIRAYAQLPDAVRQAHQLVLVCGLHRTGHLRLTRLMADLGLSHDDVVLAGHVDDHQLRILYANASLFVFPSFHEGFGLPALEAMWCGAPTIGSSLSSVPEVIGRSDILFDPHDTAEMSALIARVLTDDAYRQALQVHARNHARNFCWDKVAQAAIASLVGLPPAEAAESIPHDIDRLIQDIAKIDLWPGPTSDDLVAVARAVEANRLQTWPTSVISGMVTAQML